MNETILILPSSLEASLAGLKEAQRWGNRVIGSSSISNDPYAALYDAWDKLPFIHEPSFICDLQSLIQKYGIVAIMTPHAPTFLRLTELKDQLPNIRLIGESPHANTMLRVQAAYETAKSASTFISKITNNSDKLSANFLSATLAHAIPLYGECSLEKMAALCAIFCEAPKGDVVEIGTFFGKSAYVLNRLASHFGTGATIAVDPWDFGESVQTESPKTIQALSAAWDWEIVFKGFLLAMQSSYAAPFNYIRAPSITAYIQYCDASEIVTLQFGTTKIKREIAVLHIDGNHDEQAVAADLACWGKHVTKGGWIIFDDYEWSQGDGPRKVADLMIRSEANRIERHFVAGGAAFIKLKD